MRNYSRNDGRLKAGRNDLFIGLDVDKASISVAVRDSRDLLRILKMPYDASRRIGTLVCREALLREASDVRLRGRPNRVWAI